MKSTNILLAAFSALCLLPSSGYSQSNSASAETQKSAAGVMAVEDHWSLAEAQGDTLYIDQLLLPEYRSVNANGTAYPKTAIIAGAVKRIGTTQAAALASIADYHKTHPSGKSVVIQGNTAIISFYSTALGPDKGVKSSDILVYVDGHWHGMYSQHTGVM